MSEKLIRQWTLLQLIPREPYSVTAGELKSRLEQHGYQVTTRTVQRNLEALATPFGLTCDTEGATYHWYWPKHARAMSLPGMDPVTALTFHLADEFLQDLLPAQARERLSAHVRQARQILKASEQYKLVDWADRVVVIPPGQRLHSPEIPPQVMEAVSEGLLRRQKVHIVYRPRKRGGESVTVHSTSPLGLVVRAHTTYLVCHLHTGPHPSHLAMHRIEEAKLLDEPAEGADKFDLDAYVEAGFFDYPQGDTFNLVARFEESTAYHLRESPLHPRQQIVDDEKGWVRLTANVQDTQQLRWWLLGFGPRVEVIRPKRLREEIAKQIESASNLYK